LVEESQVVLEEQADVGNSVFSHSEAFDAEAEAQLDWVPIDTACGHSLRSDAKNEVFCPGIHKNDPSIQNNSRSS
jgi:hypothetical protein